MGLKKHLNEVEKGQIVAFHNENMSLSIADVVGRDASTLYPFLKNLGKKDGKERPRNGTRQTSTGKRRQ